MEEILAQGIWCTNCEFFELAEDIEEGKCNACGCNAMKHVGARVVEYEPS